MSIYESFKKVIASLGMEQLTHPIFHNSPIGIRFNIGDNGNDVYIDKRGKELSVNPNYITACLERSLKIYHSLKSKPDILAIEGYIYKNTTVKDFIASVVTATDLPQPNEIKSEIAHDDGHEIIHVLLLWNINDFKPHKLLEEIIKADLGSGNFFLTSSVYFVCTKDNVLFHLYDDRGADLVADKKVNIQHIYHKLNDLISDYDREIIDNIFNTKQEEHPLKGALPVFKWDYVMWVVFQIQPAYRRFQRRNCTSRM